MNILLHTIALEPARWTPQRVSQNLVDLLPKIARTPFKQIEIYEPHLTSGDESAIQSSLAQHQLAPVMLSSYIQVGPNNTNDEKFATEKEALVARVRRFGFQKVRLFPGGGISPEDKPAVEIVERRIAQIARELSDVEVLLETHDHSIADSPIAIVELIERIGLPNLAILWQPLAFDPESALEQFAIQKHLVRHFHLQNRYAEGPFATLKSGMVAWGKILEQLNVDATIEFVPSGICPMEQFDVATTLAEIVSEADYVRSL